MQNNRWIRIQFRLLASVPPIVFGILERNLGTITDYAGTTGFVIGFSFPAVLYLQSKAVAKKKWTLEGSSLLWGEVNCPPENSEGCDGLGRYGNILKMGEFQSTGNNMR